MCKKWYIYLFASVWGHTYIHIILWVLVFLFFTLCVFVWVSYIDSVVIDMWGWHVTTYVSAFTCFNTSFFFFPKTVLKCCEVVAQNSPHKQKYLAFIVQLYRNWQHTACQGVYCWKYVGGSFPTALWRHVCWLTINDGNTLESFCFQLIAALPLPLDLLPPPNPKKRASRILR